MAFPGTYNFNYYRGDTFSFIISPKDGNGDPYSLTGYGASFWISDKRGSSPTVKYVCEATVSTVNNTVTCIIPSNTVGRLLTTDKTWVYDVQIKQTAAVDNPTTYTLLNGNITVTDDITGASTI